MTCERGGAGLTVVLSTVVVLVVGLAGVTAVADLAATSARARVAADAAALAAVGASPLAGGGTDPQVQARQLAAANDAELLATDDLGWPLRYGVTVAVQPSTRWVRRLVGPVRAGAVAALRPRRSSPGGPP